MLVHICSDGLEGGTHHVAHHIDLRLDGAALAGDYHQGVLLVLILHLHGGEVGRCLYQSLDFATHLDHAMRAGDEGKDQIIRRVGVDAVLRRLHRIQLDL